MSEDRLQLAGRASTAAGLLGVAALLLVFETGYRHVEAVVAAAMFGVGTPTLASPGASIVYFGLGRPHAFGLDITPECSSGLLIAPLAVVGAALLWRRRIRVARVLAGMAVVGGLLVLGNQLRVGLIAWLIKALGLRTGYEWGHVVAGSLVSMVFIAGGLALLVWIVATGRPAQRAVGS